MRMTNQSWEAAACGAIERKLYTIMMTNDWGNQRFVDEEAENIWRSMYRKFCEDYPNFSEEKKNYLRDKFIIEFPTFSEEKKKWFLDKIIS